MSIQTVPLPSPPVHPAEVPTEPIYRLTVEQYHQMIQVGIFMADDPVELLEGWLVQKMGKNPPHRVTLGLLRDALDGLVPSGWYVDSQEPITFDTSEPEPDIEVIRGTRRDYTARHPGPAETALVVEVADTSLRRDRGFKKRIYARAAVPVYWIVNLVDRQIEVYTEPTGSADQPDYRQRKDFGPTDQVPVVIEGREVGRLTVADVLA